METCMPPHSSRSLFNSMLGKSRNEYPEYYRQMTDEACTARDFCCIESRKLHSNIRLIEVLLGIALPLTLHCQGLLSHLLCFSSGSFLICYQQLEKEAMVFGKSTQWVMVENCFAKRRTGLAKSLPKQGLPIHSSKESCSISARLSWL